MGDLGLWPTAHDARAKPVQLSLSTRGRQRFGCTSGSATRTPRCRLATLSWGTQAFLLSTRLQVGKRDARCFGGDQCSGARRRSHRHGARVSVYKMSHPWRGPAVSHPEAQDASRRERLHMSLSLSLESCCPWHPTSEPCSLALQPLLPRSSRDTYGTRVALCFLQLRDLSSLPGRVGAEGKRPVDSGPWGPSSACGGTRATQRRSRRHPQLEAPPGREPWASAPWSVRLGHRRPQPR